MGESGFWEDSETAGKGSAEHARTARRLKSVRPLAEDAAEREGLAAPADEHPATPSRASRRPSSAG